MGSVRELLARSPVTVSAPCRVDTGGTWDIKALALPLEWQTPATVNMALTLRTTVTLHPYEKGRVKIFSKGFSHTEEASADRLPFDSPFGLFFAAVSYFGFRGVAVEIDSQSPVKSALGGSSTALVALLGRWGKWGGKLGYYVIIRSVPEGKSFIWPTTWKTASAVEIAVFRIRPRPSMAGSTCGNGILATRRNH